MLNVVHAERHCLTLFAKRHYAECGYAEFGMLSVVMLNVIC
jgi:hypothetical protein